MKHYEHVVIGFGKGGKTLAGALAKAGHSVALIERDPAMYGGTCINVACIPSKFLEDHARASAMMGGSFEEKAARYRQTILQKRDLTAALRAKNYAKAAEAGVEVIDGEARFLDDRHVAVATAGGELQLEAEKIYVNTGALPVMPAIAGAQESRYTFTSEGMMELESLPRRLVIVGGGYIGLEFASYYLNFGSEVTMIQNGGEFLPREDAEVAAAVRKSLEARGLKMMMNAETRQITDENGFARVTVELPEGIRALEAEAVLVAAGRRPNLEGLHPEAAGIALTSRGAIETNEHLQTSAANIYAMGDVAGGLQFTYISLDDSRIVRSAVMGDGSRTTRNRPLVPYSVFIDPPFSRVGLTEEEAKKQYGKVAVARLEAAAIPKAKVLGRTDGLLKAVIDPATGKLLGAHFFCAESHELINLVRLAMDAGIPYPVLRDSIYTHPTMTEALNDLFAAVKE